MRKLKQSQIEKILDGLVVKIYKHQGDAESLEQLHEAIIICGENGFQVRKYKQMYKELVLEYST